MMDVTMRNGIKLCPKQCVHSDIRSRKELVYGTSKTSVSGVTVYVTCAHAGVCSRLAKRRAEREKEKGEPQEEA